MLACHLCPSLYVVANATLISKLASSFQLMNMLAAHPGMNSPAAVLATVPATGMHNGLHKVRSHQVSCSNPAVMQRASWRLCATGRPTARLCQ